MQQYLLFSFLRYGRTNQAGLCAYQNCNFEPDYAYKRYTYKKMSVSYPKLINFREDFFLRGQVK